MKRVTYKTIIERQTNSEFQDFPKLRDILVDLSVKDSPKVNRKLRLIGFPIMFMEYNDKKRTGEKSDNKNDYKTVRVPFCDADVNRKITRIGHENPQECYWKAQGYIGSRKFAIRCLEEQEDGTWVPKILCKGPAVFNEFATWEQGRVEEDEDGLSSFLGGINAPTVRVQATKDTSKLGGVDYKVFVGSKDMPITEEIIEQLRAIQEPSADELNALRAEYEAERAEDHSLPEWHDFYEFGFNLKRIFKYTPPMDSSMDSEAINTSREVFNSRISDGSTEDAIASSVAVLDKDDEEEKSSDSSDDFGDITW